jgi:hypothetical protein
VTDRRPGRTGAHRAPTRHPRALVLGAVTVVAGAIVVGLLVAGPDTTTPPDDAAAGSPPSTYAAGPGVADPAAALVDWIEVELPVGTPLVADDAVRSRLLRAGADGGRIRAAAPDDEALQVVEGQPPDGAAVLVRFGDAPALSVVDPAPGEPAAAELDRRQTLAEAVLANPTTGAVGKAARVLRDAHVDARLLSLLAVLVSRHEVGVAAFPTLDGEPADGPPARRVLLDRADGEALAPGSAAADLLTTFLEAQRPPFAPDTVEQTTDGVLVGFDYVSAPDAVVSAGAR